MIEALRPTSAAPQVTAPAAPGGHGGGGRAPSGPAAGPAGGPRDPRAAPASARLAPGALAARKLGLFGGSFDPPHRGHLHVARAAREAFGLDHVVLIPAAQSPLKEAHAPAAERVAMLELLLQGAPAEAAWMSIWTGELERPGPSYTIDTARALRAELQAAGRDVELYWLLGSDNLEGLGRWREAEELLRLVRPIVIPRGVKAASIDPLPVGGSARGLSSAARARLAEGLVDVEPVPISSSELRRRLAGGLDPGDALPPLVREYIEARGIYRPQ